MKAVIYARYSSHNQREESIEDQVRICEEAAAANGDEIVAVYFDKAATGTNDNRAGFLSMIAESAGSSWSRVWTYKTDRFARNRYDAAIYKRRLQKNKVDVRYAAEPIPEGPMGILMESVLEGMAEYFSANLGENVARGLGGNALKCHPNGVRLFGWDIAGARIDDSGKFHPGDRYEVNRKEAAAVRAIFELRACGYSYRATAEKATELGYRTKDGSPIGIHNVEKVIKDERYKGVYHYGGVRIPGGMPAIVTEEEWLAAQTPNARKKRKRKKHRKHIHVVEGMVFGDLEVKSLARITENRNYVWLCECRACGGAKVEWAQRLTNGEATHCGCRSTGQPHGPDGRFVSSRG